MSRKLLIACVMVASTLPLAAQNGAKNSEWRAYAGEPGSTKYSPLDQINKDNAKTLRIAWRVKTDNPGAPPPYNMGITPITVDRGLDTQAGPRRDVAAGGAPPGGSVWIRRV